VIITTYNTTKNQAMIPLLGTRVTTKDLN